MQTDHGLSARRADRVLHLSRSARHYRPRVRDYRPLIAAIEVHLKGNPGHGFGWLFELALRPVGSVGVQWHYAREPAQISGRTSLEASGELDCVECSDRLSRLGPSGRCRDRKR